MMNNGMTIFCEEATLGEDFSLELDPRRALMVEFINREGGKGVRTVKLASTMLPVTKVKFPPTSVFQMQNIADPTILDGFKGNLSGLVLSK